MELTSLTMVSSTESLLAARLYRAKFWRIVSSMESTLSQPPIWANTILTQSTILQLAWWAWVIKTGLSQASYPCHTYNLESRVALSATPTLTYQNNCAMMSVLKGGTLTVITNVLLVLGTAITVQIPHSVPPATAQMTSGSLYQGDASRSVDTTMTELTTWLPHLALAPVLPAKIQQLTVQAVSVHTTLAEIPVLTAPQPLSTVEPAQMPLPVLPVSLPSPCTLPPAAHAPHPSINSTVPVTCAVTPLITVYPALITRLVRPVRILLFCQ